MKEGDVVEAFGNPLKQTNPLGKARLVELVKDYPKMQLWIAEMKNNGNRYGEVLIKKPANGKTTEK